MKKLVLILLLLPIYTFAQTIDLNEMSINGTIDQKGYYADITPKLIKKEYGKMVEYKIRFGDNAIELLPCNKQVTGKKMMAEMKKVATSKIKGLTIKVISNKPYENVYQLTRDGVISYKANCIISSKGKEYFAMIDCDTTEEDARHLLEIIQTFKLH